MTHEAYEKPCARCGEPVDVLSSSTLFEVTGWALPRRGGGLHHLRDQHRTGRVLHASCKVLGAPPPDQGQLV